MSQTDDGTFTSILSELIADWASTMDDSENTFGSRRSRAKPPLAIEHRAESNQTTRTTVTYPIIRPPETHTGIKPHVDNLLRGIVPKSVFFY